MPGDYDAQDGRAEASNVGNSLAVRIPSKIARIAKLSPGQPVEILVGNVGLTIVPVGRPAMTLADRLQRFDPSLHGGESP